VPTANERDVPPTDVLEVAAGLKALPQLLQ